jgi:hypothetical protein
MGRKKIKIFFWVLCENEGYSGSTPIQILRDNIPTSTLYRKEVLLPEYLSQGDNRVLQAVL